MIAADLRPELGVFIIAGLRLPMPILRKGHGSQQNYCLPLHEAFEGDRVLMYLVGKYLPASW